MRCRHLLAESPDSLWSRVPMATPAATAQTVISNETLVSTTFVVNKQSATAKCGTTGCSARSILVRSYFNHMSGSDRADVYFAPEPAQRVP